jgi:Phage integrase family
MFGSQHIAEIGNEGAPRESRQLLCAKPTSFTSVSIGGCPQLEGNTAIRNLVDLRVVGSQPITITGHNIYGNGCGGDADLAVVVAERRRLTAALRTTPRMPETAGARADLRTQLQTVRVALAKVRTQVQTTELKSARSRRTIALPHVAVAALRAHLVRQLEARLAAGGRWQDRGLVFTSSIGTPLESRNVTRAFKALLTAATLPNIRFHDLRHSCATLLLAQGVNPRVVMETLGHSQVSLTLNTYSHVLPALNTTPRLG